MWLLRLLLCSCCHATPPHFDKQLKSAVIELVEVDAHWQRRLLHLNLIHLNLLLINGHAAIGGRLHLLQQVDLLIAGGGAQ